jgi:hypothetical protein
MNSLKTITARGYPTMSAEEFWRRYDAKEFK